MVYDPDRLVKQIGKRIAQLRREKGFSQGTFAEKIRSTPQWISQLERGTRSPTIHTLCKIANALDVALGDLLTKPTIVKRAEEGDEAAVAPKRPTSPRPIR